MGRRNDLAGLAALGALGMILKDKNNSQSSAYTPQGVAQPEAMPSSDDMSLRGGPEDERPAPTGMAEATRLMPNKTPSRKPDLVSAKKALDQVPIGNRRGPSIAEARSMGPQPSSTIPTPQQRYLDAIQEANSAEGRAQRQAQAEAQALTPVRPEEYIIGSPMQGIKSVASLARGLANRQAARGVEKAADYSQPALTYTERKLLESSGGRPMLGGPPKRLTGPSAKETSRSGDVVESGREAVTNPMAWAGGPKSMRDIQAAEDAARVRQGLSEMDTTGGAIGYKRGGKVKKSFSIKPTKTSASSRGDGIAMRGKTRGIMR
jgi:hypothetical protein